MPVKLTFFFGGGGWSGVGCSIGEAWLLLIELSLSRSRNAVMPGWDSVFVSSGMPVWVSFLKSASGPKVARLAAEVLTVAILSFVWTDWSLLKDEVLIGACHFSASKKVQELLRK